MSDHWIIDPSVLIQFYIVDTFSLRVRTLMGGLSKSPPDQFYIPEFGLLECTNILWKHVRFSGLSIDHAKQSIQQLRDLPLIVHSARNILDRAFEIGIQHQLAVYDSAYIALAENLDYPLISVDAKQLKVAAEVGIKLKPVTDFAEFS
jgi:predicted nucleic acid-binding protein